MAPHKWNDVEVRRRRKSRVEAEKFQFACYNTLQTLAAPSSAKAVAEHMHATRRETEIREILAKLVKQMALSRKQIRGTWHYYI
jgi:hypothetical protein